MRFLNNLSFLVLRVSAGGMMIFGHGLPKLQNPDKFIEGLAAKGYPAPALLGYAAISSETLFPLLIVLGLFTRVSALIAAANMFVAGFVHHLIISGDPFSNLEKALLYMVIFICIVITGPGDWNAGKLLGVKAW